MTNKWLIMAAGFLAGLGCALLFALAVQAQTPTPTPDCPFGATPGPTVCPGACGCCTGDANRNGFVNTTDFATVVLNFGAISQSPLGMGDANCDGWVNYSDYGAVQHNFGKACP